MSEEEVDVIAVVEVARERACEPDGKGLNADTLRGLRGVRAGLGPCPPFS